MKIQSYKDLLVWQKSLKLVKEIYLATNKLPKSEDYGLSSQSRRAAVSIPSNIAEGYYRRNIKEYIQFLYIALASCAELETQMMIIKDIYGKISFENAESILCEVMKMLSALIKSLEDRK